MKADKRVGLETIVARNEIKQKEQFLILGPKGSPDTNWIETLLISPHILYQCIFTRVLVHAFNRSRKEKIGTFYYHR